MAQKEIDCQGVSARMMDLLYGELQGDERGTVEAHLAGCPSCRAELAAFQSTRASARLALDADQPPARAHQAILRAAAAAVAAKQAKPIEARAATREPSFWARWRTRWTLPTFATLGAVAVVVLASKVFLEPDKTVELGRQALQSAPAEAPAAPPAAKPPATAELAEANEDEQAKQAPPAAPAKKRKGEAREQLQPSVAQDAPARSIAAPAAAQRQRAAPGGPAAREFAPPPPPLAEPAPSSPPAANLRTGRDNEREALEETAPALRGGVGHVAGGSGAAPPAVRATAKKTEKKADKKAEMPSEMDDLDRGAAAKSAPAPRRAPAAPAAASVADQADAESEARAESKPVAESPVARADRLFAQGQWAAAARAYRELLRRDPGNGDAARWRQRLAASEEAASGPPAAASPASGGR
jgi:anti-sigma factor RsiW